uniref:ATP synthase F0 subunit 8 n=1 Tax=Hydromanicus huapingensis TaxID=1875469 RepID=UPI0022387372|nr:ATP synthase F0 subunit 8 [Hydromanicus huapingensis]UYO79243.1 ATP synthase F0 subunit 8 [Hydromanicus huapingensis]
MPQMMPLNWLILMIFFTLIFLFTYLILYFNYSFKIKKSFSQKSSNIQFNWKW